MHWDSSLSGIDYKADALLGTEKNAFFSVTKFILEVIIW